MWQFSVSVGSLPRVQVSHFSELFSVFKNKCQTLVKDNLVTNHSSWINFAYFIFGKFKPPSQFVLVNFVERD